MSAAGWKIDNRPAAEITLQLLRADPGPDRSPRRSAIPQVPPSEGNGLL